MFVVGLAPRRKRKQTLGIMLDRLTKSRGGRMEIHFEAGLKRPRDATESAKLVSEVALAVRCHARILPTWIQYRNEKDNTQFNTFLDHMLFITISNIVLLCPILSSFLLIRLTFFFQQMRFKLDPKDDATRQACTHVFQSALR